jgi:hypothetical protein
VKTEATGLYSRKAIERLGFTVAAEFLYADYEVQLHENPPILITVLFPRKVTLKFKNNSQPINANFTKKQTGEYIFGVSRLLLNTVKWIQPIFSTISFY